MAKGGHKRNTEIDDLIMLEDSTRGTLCAIHQTINSMDNFPCSNHQMLKLCPVPKSQLRNTRFKRKSRSNSPCRDRPKTCRALSANPPGYFCAPSAQIHCTVKRNQQPAPSSYKPPNYHVNVEKTMSCPGNMCGHPNHHHHSFTSQSSVQIEQFTQNLLDTDEVVNELKGEIEKVKHQLHHLSRQRLQDGSGSKTQNGPRAPPPTPEDRDESVLAKLKSDNRRLKRELEAKKKLLEKSRSEVAKAKDILTDYEKKVGLLHVQAVKSSKTMKKSKEAFCLCIKEKDTRIRALRESNEHLEQTVRDNKRTLNEKEEEVKQLNESIQSLKQDLEETSTRCSLLNETNQNFLESIDLLRAEVDSSTTKIVEQKETIQNLEQKICELNCVCKKVVSRTKRQKDSYETLIKNNSQEQEKMTKQISELSIKVEEAEKQKGLVEQLQCKCREYEEQSKQYEAFAEKCKELEENCKNAHEKLLLSENTFNMEKQEMGRLISELTDVVKENKVTITQMSDINKQQEIIIQTQSTALLTKEEQLRLIEKESENFKKKSSQLEKEILDLRKSLSEPCSKEACLCTSKELEQLKEALNVEKDNQLLKEKIIQDQSQTILNLQSQVKDKIRELTQAQDDTRYLEEEIGKINEKLISKHEALDLEIDEKESLMEKLRIVECQKNQLSEEIMDFEQMLHNFKETCGDNEKQRAILKNLEDEISEQRREWESQRHTLGKEKEKAVCAAKFATRKLLDTVEDFQRQVDAQKKVQLLLTKMLHEKDEELKFVQSKISSINTITRDLSHSNKETLIVPGDDAMKELFFQKAFEHPSLQSDTNPSVYSSCSSSIKKPECAALRFQGKNTTKVCAAPCSNISQLLKVLSSSFVNAKEEPSRDAT